MKTKLAKTFVMNLQDARERDRALLYLQWTTEKVPVLELDYEECRRTSKVADGIADAIDQLLCVEGGHMSKYVVDKQDGRMRVNCVRCGEDWTYRF